MVALCLVALIALTALAIDIGMIAVAKSQVQNAADSAAMAGARTFNGNAVDNYNVSEVPKNAIFAAESNRIFNQNVKANSTSINKINDHTYESQNVQVEIGAYAYLYNDSNPDEEKFYIQIPRTDVNEPYSSVRATVNHSSSTAFGRFLGMNIFSVKATATAAHRPRDVIIIMDLSGSMRFQSLMAIPHTGNRTTSMNPDPAYPRFGHYSDINAAALYGNKSYPTTTSEFYDPANITVETNSGPPIVEDFFQNATGTSPSAGTRAFARKSDNFGDNPNGDNYLKKNENNTGEDYARTASEIVPTSNLDKVNQFEQTGYQSYVSNFDGFTEGPSYWGKTFFIWPPDPRGSQLDANNPANHANNGAKDWRQRFFFKVNTSNGQLGWLDHNNLLFDSNGYMRDPDSSLTVSEDNKSVSYRYRINYAAIFHWLKHENPKPFPEIVRAGRILYYDSIPDPNDTTLNDRFWTRSLAQTTDLNERLWREYVDFVLGLRSTGAGTYDPKYGGRYISAMIGNGDRFTWETRKITQKPDAYQVGRINNSGGYPSGHTTSIKVDNAATNPSTGHYVKFQSHDYIYQIKSVTTDASGNRQVTLHKALQANISDNDLTRFYSSLPGYMNYADNPTRPRHQFWFGPITFIDFLGNYNMGRMWWPGNVHEAQAWACKAGIQTAIDDIKKNHPSDFIGMAFFSNPRTSRTGSGQHNNAVVPLGRNYQLLKDSLWFPPSTVVGGVKEINPYHSDFDNVPRANGGTAPMMGFMIAYNLFSSSPTHRFYAEPQPQYRGSAGGLGRKGASRLIIFESDGAPNTRAFRDLVNAGSNSYYPVRVRRPGDISNSSNVEFPQGGSYSNSELFDVVKQICALETANPPGYSTKRKPVQIHCIAYGSLFDPLNAGSNQTNALSVFQQIQYYGNAATSSDPSAFPEFKKIYGTNDQRVQRMQEAFTRIMQAGIQVSLIE